MLNLELVELRSKVRSQAATADRQRVSGQKNDAMAQQIDALTQSQTQSKIDLAQSRQQVDQARAQQQKIEQQMKMLSAKMEAERQKFAAEKQQLLEQVSAGPNSGEQLAASQLQVKSLQAQLDSLKLTSTKSSDARIAALTADKQASDEKAKELQTKLDAALANKPVTMVTNPLEVTKEQLKQKASREAYAIGMSLGAEILQMQAENAINDLPKDGNAPNLLI